jgi:hypothetical protein
MMHPNKQPDLKKNDQLPGQKRFARRPSPAPSEGSKTLARLACAAVLCLILALGCARHGAPGDGAPPSLPQAKQAVVRYYESGQWEKACRKTAEEMLQYVRTVLAADNPEKPAVVVGLDDVLLSSFALRKSCGFCPTPKDKDAWMIMDFMPAAPGMADMVEALQFSGVSVFVVSSRPESLRLPTLENLAKAGYAPQTLFLVPPPDRDLTSAQFQDKIRTMLARQGFTILATLDDHQKDVGEENTEKVFIVPNLMY